MTTSERVEAIKRAMKQRAKVTASTKASALKLLSKEGIYTSTGELSAKYGGRQKKLASVKR